MKKNIFILLVICSFFQTGAINLFAEPCWTQPMHSFRNVQSFVVSGSNLFAGTWGGGVFLSTNNGTNWTPVNSGMNYNQVNTIVVSELIFPIFLLVYISFKLELIQNNLWWLDEILFFCNK
jgi:hypothetical protein